MGVYLFEKLYSAFPRMFMGGGGTKNFTSSFKGIQIECVSKSKASINYFTRIQVD